MLMLLLLVLMVTSTRTLTTRLPMFLSVDVLRNGLRAASACRAGGKRNPGNAGELAGGELGGGELVGSDAADRAVAQAT